MMRRPSPIAALIGFVLICVSGSAQRAYVVKANVFSNSCGSVWDIGRGLFLLAGDLNTLDANVIAQAELIDRRNLSGWDELVLVANSTGTDSERRFAVGALEGFLTSDRIANLAVNAKSMRQPKELPRIMYYLHEWHVRVRRRTEAGLAKSDAYWLKVQHVLDRFDGLVTALNHPCASSKVSYEDLLLLQNDGDVAEIEALFSHEPDTLKDSILLAMGHSITKHQLTDGARKAQRNDAEYWTQLLSQSKCSALVRYTSSGDVILGHTTWANYAEMIRVFKHVDYGNQTKTSYSGFAGMIASTDDFYVTANGLAVMETSLNVIDVRSIKILSKTKYQGVPSWIRTVLAMENAKSGSEWVDLFSREFSNTYNNQWMVLDKKHRSSSSGLFILFESLPGIYDWRDMTVALKTQGFFSSQNTPLLNSVRNEGGYPNTEEQLSKGECHPCGCLYSYDNNPRGCIFAREAPNIETIEQMKVLIRSNNWKSDPLSLNRPEEAIAGRFDLEPDVKLRSPNGAIDGKVLVLESDSDFASTYVVGGIVVNSQCPIFTDMSLFQSLGLTYTGISGLTGNEQWFRTVI